MVNTMESRDDGKHDDDDDLSIEQHQQVITRACMFSLTLNFLINSWSEDLVLELSYIIRKIFQAALKNKLRPWHSHRDDSREASYAYVIRQSAAIFSNKMENRELSLKHSVGAFDQCIMLDNLPIMSPCSWIMVPRSLNIWFTSTISAWKGKFFVCKTG